MRTILVRGFKIAGKSLAVLVIVAIVGWFAIPSLRMYQFESALANEDNEAAAAMIDGPRTGPNRIDIRDATFDVPPMKWEDFFTGRRFISVRATYVFEGKEYQSGRTYWATPFFLDKYGC